MLDKFLHYNTEKLSKNVWFYFFLIVIINTVLKSIQLGFSSFWYDEIISVQSASLDFGHIKHVSEWDNNPPFYFYCLSVWIKLFNDSEFVVRFLSVLFSSLSGGVLFLLANKYFNKFTAFIVSLLFLSNNLLFFYSHEARAYSLVLFLSLLSSLLYFNLKEKPTTKTIILLGVINFLLIYTHYISGLVLFFQFILMLVYFERKQKISFLYSTLIILGLVLIRFTKKQLLLIVAFNNSKSTFWLKKSDLNYLQEVLSSFLFHNIFVIPFLLILVFTCIYGSFNKNKSVRFSIVYSFFLGLGSIFILFFLGKMSPLFLDRYLIFTIPFILILLAYGLSLIKYKYVVLTIVALFSISCIYKINYKTDKGMDYRSVVAFTKHFKTKQDLIIVKTKDIKSLFCYYYDKDYLKLKKENLPVDENVIFCTSWQDVTLNVNAFKTIVVIDSFQDYNTHEGDFVANLSKTKSKKSEFNGYNGVRISFYQ
jgi:hypothetical protein